MFINTVKPKLRSYLVNLLYDIKNFFQKQKHM